MTGKQLKNYDGNKFYNGNALDQTGAPWLCVLSERSDGKSLWWVKYCIMDYFKTGHKFGYVRRYEENLKEGEVNRYFGDKNLVAWLEKAGYTGVKCWRGELWLTKWDDKNLRNARVELIGHALPISTQEGKKGQHFDLYNFVFEEFITKKLYLPDEFTEFQNLISTANREGIFRAILIGNTIARYCPYLREMGIDIFKAKKGKIYKQDLKVSGGRTIKSAFEYVDPREKETFFIGRAEKSIVQGEFEADEQPHLHFKLSDADILYKCVLVTDIQQAFHVKYIMYENEKSGASERYLYVYPMDYDDVQYSFDDIFSTIPAFESGYFYHAEKKRQRHLYPLLAAGRVLYSDNLTGTEFLRSLKKHNPFKPSMK